MQWTWDLYNEKKVWFDNLPVRKDRETASKELADFITGFDSEYKPTGRFFEDLAYADRALQATQGWLMEEDAKPENCLKRITETVHGLEGQVNVINAQVQELRKRFEERVAGQVQKIIDLQEQVGKLQGQLETKVKALGDGISAQLSGKALKGDLAGLVSERDLAIELGKAQNNWQIAVREAIEETLEGKNQRTALEWWDRAIKWLNEKPNKEASS